MTTSMEELREWMTHPREHEHLEFKEAKNRFDFEELVDYCAALANEGGGAMVLGVSDKRPRKIVGTLAFAEPDRTKAGITERLHLRIETSVLSAPEGRVLVFHIPSRPLGVPVGYKGRFLMRSGESVVPMTTDQIRKILEETDPDFSAEVCRGLTLSDLDPRAIAAFRQLWRKKSGNHALEALDDGQLLNDAELIVTGGITFAALILLGKRSALGQYLAQAEVVFEYRSTAESIEFQQRKEYREGFVFFFDELWNTINLRNDVQHFQEGLFISDIPTFTESVVREALLNAVSHRDYRLAGSIFVRQFPRTIEIVSPGGFPPGVSAETILVRQSPRNRRLAEALAKCGLVERSGQGADKMFQDSIRQGKPEPDFRGTDDHQVSVTLDGKVQDSRFLRLLEAVAKERQKSFSTADLVVLDRVARDLPMWPSLKDRLPTLLDEGLIERVGHGKGARYILSRRFHHFLGRKGEYTRKRGLDTETQKTLLLQHIERSGSEGCQFKELQEVLPNLSRDQVQSRLRELKSEGRAHPVGVTKNARWVPGPAPAEGSSAPSSIASKKP